MIPRWHILSGAIFTLVIWFFAPSIHLGFLILLFLSTFLIDFDHYIIVVHKTKKTSLLNALKYYKKLRKIEEKERKKGIRNKGYFHVFHTVEFHLLIALFSLIWTGFFYIFLGMVFHSLIDLAWLLHQDRFYIREFFFFSWIRKKLN